MLTYRGSHACKGAAGVWGGRRTGLRSLEVRKTSVKQLAVLIVFMFLSLALTVSTPETPSSQELPTRPNIVVVMTDDQEARSVRYMSQVKHRLGARGTSFANFFASQPLCCPDRATFLTGLYPHNHGIHNNDGSRFWRTGLDHSTVATWLKGSGYKTAYFGKYLNHYWPPHEGTTRP
jgi:N-acetylglucosamine-6-sulfatase